MTKTANYTKIAIRGAATVFVISAIAALFGYLVRLVLARGLSVEDFGLFNAVFAFLGMIGAFKSLGFDKALIKFIPEFLQKNRKDLIKSSIVLVSIVQLITNTAIIVLIYLLSDYLALKFFHTSSASWLLRLMAFAFFVDSFVMVLKFSFQGFRKMAHFSSIDLTRMVIILAIVLIGTKMNYGLQVAAFAYIAAPIIVLAAFFWIFSKKVFPEISSLKSSIDMALVKKISSYGIFVTETSIAALILYYTDIMVLTYFSTLASVGLYSIALPTAKALMYFPRAIGGVLLPLTSEFWTKGDKNIIKAGLESLYKYSMMVIVPLVLLMFVFSELIIELFYGSAYVAAADSMRILSIGMIFAIIYGININFFSGIGKPRITAVIVYSAALFNLIGNILLVGLLKMGIIGSAIITSISYFVMMVIGLLHIKKFIDIDFPWLVWLKTFLAGAIFLIAVSFLREYVTLGFWLELPVVIVASFSLYAGSLVLLKVISISELKSIYKRIK